MRCLIDNTFLAGWHWNLAFKVRFNFYQVSDVSYRNFRAALVHMYFRNDLGVRL